MAGTITKGDGLMRGTTASKLLITVKMILVIV